MNDVEGGVPRWKSVAAWTGSEVETDLSVSSTLGEEILAAGSKGKVVRDEGGAEVIVDFGRPMPGYGGFGLPPGQAWMPKNSLRVISEASRD